MSQPYRRNETAVFRCDYHFIFCPKRRRKILSGAIAARLEELLREMAPELECEIIELSVQVDHVRLSVSADPQWSPARLVAHFKGKTSRVLREEFPVLMRMPSLWTRSYFVSTAGNISSETIKQYISAQSTRN
jgi:putative transposase